MKKVELFRDSPNCDTKRGKEQTLGQTAPVARSAQGCHKPPLCKNSVYGAQQSAVRRVTPVLR